MARLGEIAPPWRSGGAARAVGALAAAQKVVKAAGPLVVLAVVLLLAASKAQGKPLVRSAGDDLRAGGKPFTVQGFNYSGFRVPGFSFEGGRRDQVIRYFRDPSRWRLRVITRDMRQAKRIGANTLRVYLELPSFMRKNGPRRGALRAYSRLVRRAEHIGVYLDVTGNLVWKRQKPWYDRMGRRERWKVQTRFWRAVARRGADSNAIFCYELTSEPFVGGEEWYAGELAGYTFVQSIALETDDPRAMARRWTERMRRAIRSRDDRHLVGIGLIGYFEGAPFSAENLADLLDVVLVHEYARTDEVDETVARVERAADHGIPTILGETFLLQPQWAAAQRSFLSQLPSNLDGTLGFYAGRGKSPKGSHYRTGFRQYRRLLR